MKILRRFTHGKHQHSQCVEHALATAEARCRNEGCRLTPIRKKVLELVWANHGPVKAYEILEKLRSEKGNVAPPTVYRALDFLLELGFVHRVASMNAYLGCGSPGHLDSGQILICRVCGQVAELDDPEIMQLIRAKSLQAGFVVDNPVIEMEGVCNRCREPS